MMTLQTDFTKHQQLHLCSVVKYHDDAAVAYAGSHYPTDLPPRP